MKRSWGVRGNRVHPGKGEVLNGRGKSGKQIQGEQMKYNADLPPVPTNEEELEGYIGEPYDTYDGEPWEDVENGEGFAYASKILGIVSIVVCCFPLVNFICSGLGLTFGIIAHKRKCKKHTLVGVVTSAIGWVFAFIGTIFGLGMIL